MHRMTAGVTRTKFSVDPLALEEELTPGEDSYNPFDDPEVSEEQKRRMEYPAGITEPGIGVAPLEFDGPMF